MSDLTRLAGELGGGCVRGDAVLVGGLGGQDLIRAILSTELCLYSGTLNLLPIGNLTTLSLPGTADLTRRQPNVQLGTWSMAAPGR